MYTKFDQQKTRSIIIDDRKKYKGYSSQTIGRLNSELKAKESPRTNAKGVMTNEYNPTVNTPFLK